MTVERTERKIILGIGFSPKSLRTAAAGKTADFEKDKGGVIKELKGLISRMKPEANKEISKISRFANWEEFIKKNFEVKLKRRNSWLSGLSEESKEELEKERKNLCDYANELHSLVRIENRLLISREETEITKIEEVKKDLEEILKRENFQTVLNLSKNGENYLQIITDTINELNEKIKGHREETETESSIGEEDLGHQNTAESDYNITAEEAKEPDLLRLDELEEEATDFCEKIINATEREFNEETIGKWFKEVERIKNDSKKIGLKLREVGKIAGYNKSTEICNIFDKNRRFSAKRDYFLEKAEDYYIKEIEELERTDEEINNIDFIKKGHYDDWKDYIRKQDNIIGIMKCFNDNLLPAVKAIPLVSDRTETVEEEVREEVEVDAKVKKSLQTLGLEVGVSEFEIRKAYRELSLQYHPKKEGSSIEDQTKYQEVQEAYKLLAADFLAEDKIFFDYSNEGDLKELEDLKTKDSTFSYCLQDVENEFKRVLDKLKPKESIGDFMLSEQREMLKNWPRYFYWFYFLNGEKNFREVDAWIKENIRESANFIEKSKIFFEKTKKNEVFGPFFRRRMGEQKKRILRKIGGEEKKW